MTLMAPSSWLHYPGGGDFVMLMALHYSCAPPDKGDSMALPPRRKLTTRRGLLRSYLLVVGTAIVAKINAI